MFLQNLKSPFAEVYHRPPSSREAREEDVQDEALQGLKYVGGSVVRPPGGSRAEAECDCSLTSYLAGSNAVGPRGVFL